MSIQAVGWVLEHSQSKGVARLVLISLANHANGETGECNPGQRRIAHEAGISPSTVSGAINRLVRIGELEVTVPGGGTRSADYHLPWLSTAIPNEPLARGSRALDDRQRAASARGSSSSARITASSARSGPRETYNREPGTARSARQPSAALPQRVDPETAKAAIGAARDELARRKRASA